MAGDALGEQFDRWRREGDLAALARVFEAVAPELLRLARHLRPRGQAPEDLVQTTFLAALSNRDGYDARRPLRPWLLGILLNKAASGRRATVGLEVEPSSGDAPQDAALAAESARLLARGLERLPPIYSEVLREHFFAGRQPAEIAERLGRPPGTVRAQLHRGLRLLRGLLPLGLAGWLAWLGPSRGALLRTRREVLEAASRVTGAGGRRAGAPPLSGVRVAGAGVVVLAGWFGLRAVSQASPPDRAARPALEVGGEEAPSSVSLGMRSDARIASGSAPESVAPTLAALLVRVRFPDGSAAPDIGLRVYQWGAPDGAEQQTHAVTDAAGEVELSGVHPGRVGLYCDRGGDQGFGVTVAPGERALSEFELPVGVRVEGEVVDARGNPVAGAGVWLSESPLAAAGRVAATCDARGRFLLRDLSPRRFRGARARGFAPSDVEWVASGGLREGAVATLRLVLRDAGGSLAGRVLDPSGAPVPGARVAARAPQPRACRLRPDGTLIGPAATLEVESDAAGRFAFEDLALGPLELEARVPGWPARVERADLSALEPHRDLDLRLRPGARVHGTVRFHDGAPAEEARLLVQDGARELHSASVDALGAFELAGLAGGEIELRVDFGHADRGPTLRETLALEPGGELRWDALVQRRAEYTGRVLDAHGTPLAGAWVRALSPGQPWGERALPTEPDELGAWLFDALERQVKRQLDQVAADGEGRFTLRRVPPEFAIEVRLPDGRTGWPAFALDPPPGNGELALTLDAGPNGVIAGSAVDADGQPFAAGEVYAVLGAHGERRTHLDGNGAFRFEGLPAGTFDLLLWARGHAPAVLARERLEPGEMRELGVLRLAR